MGGNNKEKLNLLMTTTLERLYSDKSRLFHFITYHPLFSDENYFHTLLVDNSSRVQYIIFRVSSLFLSGYIYCTDEFEYNNVIDLMPDKRYSFNFVLAQGHTVNNTLHNFYCMDITYRYGTPPPGPWADILRPDEDDQIIQINNNNNKQYDLLNGRKLLNSVTVNPYLHIHLLGEKVRTEVQLPQLNLPLLQMYSQLPPPPSIASVVHDPFSF